MSPDDVLPAYIGRYRVTGVLGEGGMGVVFEGFDEQLDRPIAVKVIRSEQGDEDLARARFWREARVAARINHPHICQIYEVGEADGRLFLAMERLEGESLSQRLERGPLAVGDAVPICLEVLEALTEVHARGITHRDLKPSNIFLTPHGAKVLDFGLAQPAANVAATTRERLTQHGTVVGTLYYMAPEQIRGDNGDSRTDVFAAGAILYEMCAGCRAFGGNTMAAVMDQVLHDELPVLGGSAAIAAVDRVIHRATAKAPAQRYATATEMATDLRTVLMAPEDTARRAKAVTRLMVLPFRLLRIDPEIDFLSVSLADAIANSLSAIESLVVRSTMAASPFVSEVPDLQRIAAEGHVDAVVVGTLLRVGDQLRVSTQLLDTPSGTVRWSGTSRATIGNLFDLEDRVVRDIVSSLALPLSQREHDDLSRDVPKSAKAFEFYLRAVPLSADAKSWKVARDLLRECVRSDPTYAPAWARLGRVYRLLGKFSPLLPSGDPTRAQKYLSDAESALNRALALNPTLALADSYYAQLELDLGQAEAAMVRLLRRASIRTTHADLFAALVSTCRYCGLLEASFAANDRARRLDPTIRTSVTHTYFMAGDYLRAADEAERHWQPGNFGGFALMCAGHPSAQERVLLEGERYGDVRLLQVMLGGDIEQMQRAIEEILAKFPDPEFQFYAALSLAHAGAHDRSIELLDGALDRGFFPWSTLANHHWLAPLRALPNFRAVLNKAAALHNHAREAFVAAGGESLLGRAT